MKNEVATKPTQAVANPADLQDWGNDQVLGQDIVLSKILPMQPGSDLVTDGKAMFGEFRDSVSGAKLGSITEPFDIIPFHVEKFWDIHTVGEDGNFEWDSMVPLVENPADPAYNDNLPWQDKVDGADIKRVRRMNFYVMLPNEIANGSDVPYVLSFKSTSFKEGKKLFTQMYLRNRKANLPPPAYSFKLGGVKEKNDKGSYIVPTVEMGRASTKEEVNACLHWFKLIKKGAAKVDNSDLTKDAANINNVADEGTGQF